jgi:BirA family biotin operon repressor/biotin-[acetyl-CoA-carboxylase] ligase
MAVLSDTFEKWYNTFLNNGFQPIHKFWTDHAYGIGEMVVISFKDTVIAGKLKGLDKDGALLVEEGVGKMHRILTGDATVLKTPKQ